MSNDYAPAISPDEDEEEQLHHFLYPPASPSAALAPLAYSATDIPGVLSTTLAPVPSDRQRNELYPAVSPRTPGAGVALYPAPIPAGEGGALPAIPLSSTPNINDEMESGASKLHMMNAATLRSSAAPSASAPAQVPVADPAEQRLQALINTGAPPVEPLHGFKKGLDVLGQVFAPGLEERLRYGRQREYQRNLGQAESDVTAELAPRAQRAKAGLEEAQAEEARAKAKADVQGIGKTIDERTFNDLLTGENGGPRTNPATSKPYTPFEAFTAVNQAKQDVKPPSAEEDKRTYGQLLNKQRKGTITPKEEQQLAELTGIYPNLVPMGEAAAGQANARVVDYLSQNPSTRRKVAGGQVPDEYRILPTDTREEAKDKEARAQALGSSAQRQIGIEVNAGEHGIEAVVAQTPTGTVYESKAAAEAAGHKILNKANPQETEKARQAYTQYGRMIDNAQEAMLTMPAWKEGSKDRDLAMRVSKQFFSHIPVVGVDATYVDQFLNSDDYRQMSQQGQAHMQNMFQIWSDAINVVKQETGGVPRGQVFLQKEDAILPHPEKTYDMNVKSLNAFVKRMKKDSSEYPRPAEMQDLQGGIAPPDAQGYINKNGKRIGYIEAQGKRVEF